MLAFFGPEMPLNSRGLAWPLLPGADPLRGGVCGVLLHVEEVGALRFLRSADPFWEEKIQPAPWGHVRCA